MKIRRVLRGLFKAAIVVALIVSAWVVGLLLQGEWEARRAASPASPPLTLAIDTSTGADDARPVLILLHGAGLNGRMWDPAVRGVDPRIRVMALDMPGHGARNDERYTLDAAADAVAAAARRVAPAKVVVAGDSLGGYTALAAASRIPSSQLAGLVLSGCSSNFGHDRLWNYASTLVMVRTLGLFADPGEWANKAVAAFGVPPADRQAIVDVGITFRAVPQAMRSLLYVDFLPSLAELQVPVLIVNGTEDAQAMAGEDRFLAAARHGRRYHFQGTPHGVSLRRGDEFASLLDSFAKGVFFEQTPVPVR